MNKDEEGGSDQVRERERALFMWSREKFIYLSHAQVRKPKEWGGKNHGQIITEVSISSKYFCSLYQFSCLHLQILKEVR